MTYKNISEIIKLLRIFIQRNVFNIGILKIKQIRYIISIFLIGLMVSMSILIFNFLNDNQTTIQQASIVLDVYGVSILMWTFIIFLFMKILFIKKNSFMLFTQQLPSSKREINIALLIFEILIAIIIVTFMSSSLVFALIYKYGVIFIYRIICNIYFTSITWYLILELVYSILISIFDFFDLDRLKNIVIYCVFTIIYIYLYKVACPYIIDELLFQYTNNNATSYFIIYSYFMSKYNFLLSSIIFISINSVLALIILYIPKNGALSNTNYLKLISKERKINLFTSYLISYSRRIDTVTYLIITIFIYLLLLITNVYNATYSVLILTINGVYSYIQTDNLRILTMQKNYSAIKDYLFLILSQCVYICFISIPFVIISIITTKEIYSNLMLFPCILLSVIIFTLIGIIIPPKRENPFAVIVGFVIIIAIIFFTIIICFIANFKLKYNLIIFTSIIIFTVYYSIRGLITLKNEVRMEK